jgi:predicted ATPase
VIEEFDNPSERYQFCHALIQETLTQQLSGSRRVRMHARIAQALEELYGVNAEAHAGELAYHFGKAELLLGANKLVHYALLAGEQALATYAWEEALQYFEHAIATKQGQPMDAEMADLLFGLARAQFGTMQTHEISEAAATLRRAFDYYYEVKDIPRAVAVAEFPIQGSSINLGRAELASRTLSLVTPGSHQAGRLLFIYGFFL